MADTVSIKGLPKAKVLAALYNGAQAQGMGFMQYDAKPLTEQEAQAILDSGQSRFGYLSGRVMKIDISGDDVNPWGYDRDNGQGRVAAIVLELQLSQDVNAPSIADVHQARTAFKASEVREHLERPTEIVDGDGVSVMQLGLQGVADVLGPKVDKEHFERKLD
jgi:hypothetical protein